MANEQKQKIYIINMSWLLLSDYPQTIAKNFKCFQISQIVNRQKRQQKQIL
jgi:hypothetical protein